jgi:hypothetical protein
MLVENFKSSCTDYENFQVWDVENLDAFFAGNKVLAEIFEADFKFPLVELAEKRSEIAHSDMKIMESMLDQIGDKHFYIFTLHNPNHLELVGMQETGIMNFGIDIQEIDPEHVYIIIMDKKKKSAFLG